MGTLQKLHEHCAGANPAPAPRTLAVVLKRDPGGDLPGRRQPPPLGGGAGSGEARVAWRA